MNKNSILQIFKHVFCNVSPKTTLYYFKYILHSKSMLLSNVDIISIVTIMQTINFLFFINLITSHKYFIILICTPSNIFFKYHIKCNLFENFFFYFRFFMVFKSLFNAIKNMKKYLSLSRGTRRNVNPFVHKNI